MNSVDYLFYVVVVVITLVTVVTVVVVVVVVVVVPTFIQTFRRRSNYAVVESPQSLSKRQKTVKNLPPFFTSNVEKRFQNRTLKCITEVEFEPRFFGAFLV